MAIYQGTSENTKLSISICHSRSRSSSEGILWQHYLPTSLTPHTIHYRFSKRHWKVERPPRCSQVRIPPRGECFFCFSRFPHFFPPKTLEPWNHLPPTRPKKNSLAKWVGFQRSSVVPCKPQTVTMPFTLTGCSSSRPILGQRQKSSTSWPFLWKLTDQPTSQDGQDTWSFRCLPLAAGGLNCSPGPHALSFKKT